MGLDDGTNVYTYVGNDPVTFIDPAGEFAFLTIFAGTAIGALSDLAFQAFLNYLDPCADWNDFDWNEVLISALIGGLGGQGAKWYKDGVEISFGKNFRVAPFGNRTKNPLGERPHYHRRGTPDKNGETPPGQGIGRHRPWKKKHTDKGFKDSF